MSVVNSYRVIYHFEVGGIKRGTEYADYVQASVGDYTTIKGVLSSNSKLKPGAASGATLVIDSVQEIGRGDVAIA